MLVAVIALSVVGVALIILLSVLLSSLVRLKRDFTELEKELLGHYKTAHKHDIEGRVEFVDRR